MDPRLKIVVATAAILVILTAVAAAPAGKQAAKGPNPPPPSPECCKNLSGTDLKCFCKSLNYPSPPQLPIDPKLTKQLFQKCRLPGPAC
ncbi:putative lipid-transfer protein DIR1 [Andrographis paniculata]|uniref:putative lipid-transfer protein DIR1 n=1 Tax=Andrographis paniculata TaxID=175694 RepID=UPI0021E82C41|nr:putative lipid-transfer protein DIR1 [Andrographis paniculata]